MAAEGKAKKQNLRQREGRRNSSRCALFLCHSCQLAPGSEVEKPGRRWKLHYDTIDIETQGDNFILIFWVTTRIINLDYEGKLMLFLLLSLPAIHSLLRSEGGRRKVHGSAICFATRASGGKLKLPSTSHLCDVWAAMTEIFQGPKSESWRRSES